MMGFVGGLVCKPVGDQTKCIGVISIHVLDDSWRGILTTEIWFW